jgi:two-component system response regulator RegA
MLRKASMPIQYTWLLVDDDEIFLETFARRLKRDNQTVFTAHNLDTVLHVMNTTHIHRVVLDLNLAGESGLTILDHIQQLSVETKVVILTGYASIASTVAAIKKGAANYLCKPASIADILQAFESVEYKNNQVEEYNSLPIKSYEWEKIQQTLLDHSGNISKTAQSLGLHRRTLQRKLKKYSQYRN